VSAVASKLTSKIIHRTVRAHPAGVDVSALSLPP
jgi:hypothetical protein